MFHHITIAFVINFGIALFRTWIEYSVLSHEHFEAGVLSNALVEKLLSNIIFMVLYIAE
jgi:hypothetical protein